MDSVKLYLLINRAIYDTDKKNIAFTLSFMKERSAAIWASTFTKKALSLSTPSLGTWTAFHDVAVLVAVLGFLRFRVGFHVHTDIA